MVQSDSGWLTTQSVQCHLYRDALLSFITPLWKTVMLISTSHYLLLAIAQIYSENSQTSSAGRRPLLKAC